MLYSRISRLLAATFHKTSIKTDHSTTRALLALLTATLILLQPAVLMAQRGKGLKTLPPGPLAPSTTILINEIDYDQVGTDTAEFVELKNVSGGAINLDNYTVQLVNGNAGGAAVYDTIDLPNVNLAAGDYYVICANAATVVNCDLDDGPDTDFIQNGSPDAVGLRDSGVLVDAVSYEGNTGAPYTENTGTPVATGSDSNTIAFIGLSRFADGTDTDNNSVDATLRCITPGAANVAAATGCTAPSALPNLTINDVSANETNAGTTTFTFTVSLSAPAGAGGVTFDIATADGTAQDDNPATEDNDYVAKSLTGQTIVTGNSSYTFDVTVNGDAVVEPTENFFVNVTNVSGASLTDGQGQGTITNDDSPNLSINDVTQAEGNGGGTTAFTFTVSLSTSSHSGVTLDICTADGTAQDDNPATEDNDYVANCLTGQTIPNGNNTYQFTVNVNADSTDEPNETFFVNVTNVTGASVTDGQGQGTITNDDTAITPIHTIQGSGSSSPIVSTTVTTRGIVTGIKSGTSGGFFIQEPDASVDADPNTSEGIFVFTGASVPAAAVVSNNVQVTGTVQEFVFASDLNSPPITELSGTITASVVSTGNPLPTPITLTVANTTAPSGTTNPLDSMEEFEGMRVTVPSMTVIAPTDGTINEPNATVSGNDVFYGVVTGVTRPFREAGVNVSDATALALPGTIPRFDENPERIRVDSDGQPGTAVVDVAAGTVIANVTGPLDYSFRTYTILPDTTVVPGVIPGAAPAPTPTANEVTVASFNMERFFDTTNDPATSDPVLTLAAFNKRLDKASQIIRGVQRYPDVIGVEEMENLTTLQAVAAQVNADAVSIDALPNPNYVAYLVEGNDIGGIDVGFLVKESRITTVSVTQIELAGCDHVTPSTCNNYTNPNDGMLDILNDRPPLVLRATAPRPGGGTFAFTVIVNHMRSLSGVDDTTPQGTGTVGDRVRAKRKFGAEFLANYIQSRQTSDPTEKILTLGDLNAFQVNDGFADVIGTVKGTPSPDNQTLVPGDGADLVNPDLTNLVDTLSAAQRYSYSFDGNAQVLDHILVNAPTLSVLTRFAYARDDADYAVKNYELPNNLRLSDHDQPIAYLSLLTPAAAGQLLITEFRLRGQSGANDEFIEVYNNTNSPHTVNASDASAGYGIVASDGVLRCTIPNGTVIPARGHYLCTNSMAYSLSGYAAGDATYTTNIPDNAGIALFNSSTTFTLANRLDAVGSTSEANTLYKEGTGYPALTMADIDYVFLRDPCGKGGSTTTLGACPSGGFPVDTDNNSTNFFFVDTNGTPAGAAQHLGAPGPENLASPIQRNSQFAGPNLDNTIASSSPPNRVRDFTSSPPQNSTFGTIEIRKRIINNTGGSVTRLRFRIVDITTFPVPSGFADLRARTSTLIVVSGINDAATCLASNGVATTPCTVNVQGTTLEQPPPQPSGGAFGSTLSSGTVTLGTPLAAGASINVRFLLGIQQTGTFKFYVNVEALP